MRGEYAARYSSFISRWELPPRARRIRTNSKPADLDTGTTSACAENTLLLSAGEDLFWNYLRVRGEYISLSALMSGTVELPPRARRIRILTCLSANGTGTTSACAENTHWVGRNFPLPGNYLRVRGEFILGKLRETTHLGTTSACAENTLNELGLL